MDTDIKDLGQSSISRINQRHDNLQSGKVTPEEYVLNRLGYTVEPYNGDIPLEQFTKPLDLGHKDGNAAGTHNQIYIEPNVPVCYKTGIVGKEEPMRVEDVHATSLPGYLQEGIFLEKMDKYRLSGIPAFLGFVKLPDGRMSVAQQYIPNTRNIPMEWDHIMEKMSTPTVMSMFEALGRVSETVDTICQLGGSINTGEIRGNMRMEMDGDRVSNIWMVDFERYGNITRIEPDMNIDAFNPSSGLGVTICTLVAEAIRTRPENLKRVVDHPVMDYLKFAVYDEENKGDWKKPRSNAELLQNVRNILKEHPLEEIRRPKYDPPPEKLEPVEPVKDVVFEMD